MKPIDRKWWVLAAIGSGTFMSALDASVVNTILPVVQNAFHSSVTTIEWVVTIYLLVLSSLLLTFGRLGDLRGHKSVSIYGFAIFIFGSALSGLSPSAGTLILFRGLQALGAAMLASNSPAILTKNFPASKRGQALGLSATMTYLGLTVGPSLGGWLAQQFSWRAVFYINVPIGALALGLSLYFVPSDSPVEIYPNFDLTGAFTFMAGLITLLLGLNQGSEWGWTSIPIIALFVGAMILLTFFVLIERHSPDPMLDLKLFRNPLFTASTVNAVFNYICLYSIVFLMPFYLIQGRSLNPAQAGLLLTAQPIVMAIVTPISGTLSDRIGSRLPGMIGMAVLGFGLYLLSHLDHATPLWVATLGLAVSGLGIGIFISPNSSALMGSAPSHQQGIASGILASGRNVGMMLGIGLSGAILSSRLSSGSPVDLFPGVREGFIAAIGIAFLGVIASAIKDG